MTRVKPVMVCAICGTKVRYNPEVKAYYHVVGDGVSHRQLETIATKVRPADGTPPL